MLKVLLVDAYFVGRWSISICLLTGGNHGEISDDLLRILSFPGTRFTAVDY